MAILFFAGAAVFAQDAEALKEFPITFARNGTDVDAIFTEQTLNIMGKDENVEDFRFDLFSYYRIGNNFTFSANALFISTTTTDFGDVRAFSNTGLICTSKFGNIGGFIGWKSKPSDEYEVGDYDPLDFSYWIVPKLNTKDYPVLGLILKVLEGYIGIEERSVKRQGQLTTKPLTIGNLTISFMDYFYKKEPYNLEASNEVYGFNMGISSFVLGGGYQTFYDVHTNAQLTYEMTHLLRS